VFAELLHLATPLLELLDQLEATQGHGLLPEQLLRMMRTAMHHHDRGALRAVCELRACDSIQPQQLAGLIAEALRTRNYLAACVMLCSREPVEFCSDDVEQLLLLAIAGLHPVSSGHSVHEPVLIADTLLQLLGVAQLTVEQLAVLLRAAIKHQAARLRNALMIYEELLPPPATKLDAVVEALCKAGQLDGSTGGDSSSSSSKPSSELAGCSKPPVAVLQELLLLALQLQSWHAVQNLCKCKVAKELSVEAAVALLLQQPAGVHRRAEQAVRAAIASALCSLPAVRSLGGDALAAVLQQLVQGRSSCSALLEGLCRLPAASQLSRGVVDGLVAAAGATGSRDVLKALHALPGV
jgi:hypothetical protein